MTATALVLRHSPDIGLGNVLGTLRAHGLAVTTLDVPSADLDGVDPVAADVLVVLGGTEGAYQTQDFPYLEAEIGLLRTRATAQRPILAICLGAQLMAAALGAGAHRGPAHEVGFTAIDVTPSGMDSPVRHVAGVAMVEWHHDTFTLPDGADLLATTAQYPQAYRIGHWLLAVQFHPEVDEAIHAGWVRRWRDDAELAPSSDDFEAAAARLLLDAQAASRAMVGEWLDALGLRAA